MTVVTDPMAAANRFLNQLITLDGAGFEKSLAEGVMAHTAKTMGPLVVDQKIRMGKEKVFESYENLFERTSDIKVRMWKVEVEGLSADCKCIIDQTKNLPDRGMVGRYTYRGHCRFDFKADQTGDLKISTIYDSVEVLKV